MGEPSAPGWRQAGRPAGPAHAPLCACAGVHELGCAERGGLVGSHHPAAAALHQGLAEFLRQDLGRACSPPHIALCGNAADRWLFACVCGWSSGWYIVKFEGLLGEGWWAFVYRQAWRCSRSAPARSPDCPCRTCPYACPSLAAPRLPRPAAWALQYLRREVTGHSPELRDAAGGLRTLVLPASHLGSLPDLAWSLSQHPRARFVVLANGLGGDGGSGGAVNGDTAAMLSGRAAPGVVAGQGAVQHLQQHGHAGQADVQAASSRCLHAVHAPCPSLCHLASVTRHPPLSCAPLQASTASPGRPTRYWWAASRGPCLSSWPPCSGTRRRLRTALPHDRWRDVPALRPAAPLLARRQRSLRLAPRPCMHPAPVPAPAQHVRAYSHGDPSRWQLTRWSSCLHSVVKWRMPCLRPNRGAGAMRCAKCARSHTYL